MDRTNPSGRLPVTFYRSVADLPAFDNYSMAHRTYRYFNGPVLYPFGFGLSYTTFTYGVPQITNSIVQAESPLEVKVTVANSGKVPGTEVAELYIQPPQVPGAPRIALSGVQRVTLRPGASRELTFLLDPFRLSFVDEQGHRAVRPGTYRLFIGGSQPNPATDHGLTFTIIGTKAMDF